ncbi:MAG: hypothetical protein JOS17DRAFT_729020 [Linnemannia elongata]|nr:MAG: hypothetical protein JOS17DRAFT_729020 [Linnemannia elongata]
MFPTTIDTLLVANITTFFVSFLLFEDVDSTLRFDEGTYSVTGFHRQDQSRNQGRPSGIRHPRKRNAQCSLSILLLCLLCFLHAGVIVGHHH